MLQGKQFREEVNTAFLEKATPMVTLEDLKNELEDYKIEGKFTAPLGGHM